MHEQHSSPLDKKQQAFGLTTAALLTTSAAMMASHTAGAAQLLSVGVLLKGGTDINRFVRREMPASLFLKGMEMMLLAGNSVVGAKWPLQACVPIAVVGSLVGNAVHDKKLQDAETRAYYNARDVQALPGGLIGEAKKISQPAHLKDSLQELVGILRRPGDWEKGAYAYGLIALASSSALQLIHPSPVLMATTVAAVVTTNTLAANRLFHREQNVMGAVANGVSAVGFPLINTSEGLALMAVATALSCLAQSGIKGSAFLQRPFEFQVGKLCESMAAGTLSTEQKDVLAEAINVLLGDKLQESLLAENLGKAKESLVQAITATYPDAPDKLEAFLNALAGHMGESYPLEAQNSLMQRHHDR
jgi:hypothetical protein